MHHLSIDLETFSSAPIEKTGLYKYIESPDFEILLLAYSIDDGPIEIIDLAQGEMPPDWFRQALIDSKYVKHAYNAVFEWKCLSKFFVEQLPIEQWRDTMLHSLYCGYPASLDLSGKAIGISESMRKISTGKALIKYFCQPCAPTKRNGGRIRNLPRHDFEKWELFKKYCKWDVLAERQIEKTLSNFPVPQEVENQWRIDTLINNRGVSVDVELVQSALDLSEQEINRLNIELIELTGLDNPNSVSQLLQWLKSKVEFNISDLQKDTVTTILKEKVVPDDVKRVLEIRSELGKTSIKKYNALENALCDDGRVRGLLQFYGANRTGRWAGRLVQVQNLPRTYIIELDLARSIIKNREPEKLRILFGSISDTLTQTIRTSFIPSDNHLFIDADFSSIEARVISWIAEEQWRLDVFNTHGKIYEASASQMFGVPIERIQKGNPEYALRQKGKVAELALGYQGGTGALIAMGALNMGIAENDLPDIVSRWRKTNQKIVKLWRDVESATLDTIQTGKQISMKNLIFSHEFDTENNLDFLTITLPSSRKLYYVNPKICINKWGNPSISYNGVHQSTKQWVRLETYGGKLTENIVQAIARDCLAHAIRNIESAGYKIAFHIHDEVIVDCPTQYTNVDSIINLMTLPIRWAKGLPLNADGWIGGYFKKE